MEAPRTVLGSIDPNVKSGILPPISRTAEPTEIENQENIAPEVDLGEMNVERDMAELGLDQLQFTMYLTELGWL